MFMARNSVKNNSRLNLVVGCFVYCWVFVFVCFVVFVLVFKETLANDNLENKEKGFTVMCIYAC